MASCSIYTNVKNALIRYPKHQPLIENGCAVLANLAVLKSIFFFFSFLSLSFYYQPNSSFFFFFFFLLE